MSNTLYSTQYITGIYTDYAFGTQVPGYAQMITSDRTLAYSDTAPVYNFDDYVIPYNADGSFTFGFAPRTPALTIDKTAVVRYMLPAQDFLPVTGTGRTPESIYLIGDSIMHGAHTSGYSLGTGPADFKTLLAEAFAGLDTTLTTFSQSGGTIEWLTSNLASIAASEHDLIVIEYGMNGHTRGAAGLANWEAQLDAAVQTLAQANKEIVLMGFFQQNPDWDKEHPADTLLYNAAIERVAQTYEAARFIDIHALFEQWETVKDLEFELLGDGLHHPNDFGHQIYFHALLPLLLDQGRIYDEFLIPSQFEAMEDLAFGDNLRGDHGSNTIVGSLADEFIFGFGGDDHLVGMGGQDSYDGGAGLDTAVLGFDARDLAIAVSEDASTVQVSAAQSDAGTPPAAGRINATIERLAFADEASGTVKTHEGVLTGLDIHSANGSMHTQVQIDGLGRQPWTSVQKRFDDSGSLVKTITTLDAGTQYANDYADGRIWRQAFTDDSDVFDWHSITRLFDDSGRKTGQSVVVDDGSHSQWTLHDNGRQTTEHYDPSGGLTRRVTSDGTDNDNSALWDEIEFVFYETGGLRRITTTYDTGDINQVFFWENGTKHFADYHDISDQFGWDIRRGYFDDAGGLTQTTYLSDPLEF